MRALRAVFWGVLVFGTLVAGNEVTETSGGPQNTFFDHNRCLWYGCSSLSAVTIYKGPAGSNSLAQEDYEVKLSAFGMGPRIVLTVMSSFEDLVRDYGVEAIRVCFSNGAKPKDGKWRSCAKVRRYIAPRKYAGPGKALDMVLVKLTEGHVETLLGVSFEPISIAGSFKYDYPLLRGYGPKNDNPPTAVKRQWTGSKLYPGVNPKCGFGDDVDKRHYLCMWGYDGAWFSNGDQGGFTELVVKRAEDGQMIATAAGLVTNYKGSYGDKAMILRFDRKCVRNFIRRVVPKMGGSVPEEHYFRSPDYYYYGGNDY